MEMPRNEFKRRARANELQHGLWLSLVDPVAAEIAAGAGYDWLVIDAEHAPNDLRAVLHQLQAIAAYGAAAIVRPVRGDVALIKQYLDLGAQTILVPMVETVEHAEEMVRAIRYPPAGIRGVASARGSRWGRVHGYWQQADRENCLIVQIETLAGLERIEAIAGVEGVDALFVGPSDLGASLGHLGDAAHPEVRAEVCRAIGLIRRAGKAAGVLTFTADVADEYEAAGATFVGLGTDSALLAKATSALLDARRDRRSP